LVGAPCILFSSQQASNESNKISINIHIMYIYFLDLNKSIYIYRHVYTSKNEQHLYIYIKSEHIFIYIYMVAQLFSQVWSWGRVLQRAEESCAEGSCEVSAEDLRLLTWECSSLSAGPKH
jgi:hypothetical protein